MDVYTNSCSACSKGTTSQQATRCYVHHAEKTVALIMLHVFRPESHSSFAQARGFLEAVAKSPPCTARKEVTAAFRLNCIEVKLEFGEFDPTRQSSSSALRNCPPALSDFPGLCMLPGVGAGLLVFTPSPTTSITARACFTPLCH